MSIDAYKQTSTGVSDITSIALVTLEIIHNALLVYEPKLWFACQELLGNQCLRAARLPRSSRQANQSLSSLISNALCTISSVTSVCTEVTAHENL